MKNQEHQYQNKQKKHDRQRDVHRSGSQNLKVHPESQKAARATAEQFKQALIDLADR